MISERHLFHKLVPLGTISLLGCLSIILLTPTAFAQVTNPSTGDTVGTYCSTGVCHTPGGTAPIVRNSNASAAVSATPIGTVKLSQTCIGDYCSKISSSIVQVGKISVKLSQVCETLLKYNMSNTCLDYKTLRIFDNTNPLYAGQWVDSPWYHRLSPKVKNHENFNPNPWAIMVDPNSDFSSNSKLITVEDGSFSWINKDEGSIGGLSVKTHADRYVNADCNEALVAPDLNIIQDTIKYLESGCSVTSFNDTKITTQKEIPFSYDNPYSTLKFQTQVSKIKATGGLGDCIHKICNYKSPYSKW